jgi:hypothetical protein
MLVEPLSEVQAILEMSWAVGKHVFESLQVLGPLASRPVANFLIHGITATARFDAMDIPWAFTAMTA